MTVRLITRILLLLLVPCPLFAATTTSITQYGITWTFDVATEYGQFANGDYWVVDPGTGVNIIDISPGYIVDGTRKKNGSMINPKNSTHGYDNTALWYGSTYSDSVNVGIGISPSTPLNLDADQSLVSTISNDAPGSTVYVSLVKNVAVLTCLATTPATWTMRPAISPDTKVLHNVSDFDLTKLKSLAYSTTKPTLTDYVNHSSQVFLDHQDAFTARYLHPSDSIYGYTSNYSFGTEWANMALLLHMDYTPEQKQPLLINFIQLGIDLYGYLEVGLNPWKADGGHSGGRKWPILFAGIMMDYAPMRDIGQVSGDYLYTAGYGPQEGGTDYFPPGFIHFGEDGQSYYVTQDDIDRSQEVGWTGYQTGSLPYTQAMLGMPEWSIRHSTYTEKGDSRWAGAAYRIQDSNAFAWCGAVMAAQIMDAEALWNAPATFDYVDRYLAIIQGLPDPCGYTVTEEATSDVPGGIRIRMYDSYRGTYGAPLCEQGGITQQVGQSRGAFLIGQ